MGRTIRGKLTLSVVLIVVTVVVLVVTSIMAIVGNTIIDSKKNELQLQAEKYAGQINTWVDHEKLTTEAITRFIETQRNTDGAFLQNLVNQYAADKPELLNLFCGTSDGRFYKTVKGDTPPGYNPVERGWYKQAAQAGKTIITDPYVDAVTQDMCATVATPVYFNRQLVAVVGADVTLAHVADLVASIDYANGAYGFLTDSTGHYITHQNKEFEPTKDTSVAAADVVPALKNGTDAIVAAEDYNGVDSYFASALIRDSNWHLGVTVPSSNMTSTLNTTLFIAFLIVLLAIAGSLVVLRKLIGKMLAPVQTLKSFASGDFSENATISEEIPQEYKDETEQIAVATTKVKQQIRSIILDTKEEASSIGMISTNASNKMNTLDVEMNKISSAVSSVFKQTKEANSITERIHTTGGEIGTAITAIAQKANNTSNQSNDIMQRAQVLYADSIEASKQTVLLYENTKKELEKAIENSSKINEIRTLAKEILSIGSQTNILALNASVEAARAGQAGKGFVVVAQEIKKLADNSTQIVSQITEITDVIIQSVADLADRSGDLLNFMNDKVVADYEKMISISKQYENDATLFHSVAKDLGISAEEMNSGMADINLAITSIAKLVREISSGMDVIEKATADSHGQTGDVASEMAHLAALSDKLNQTVAAFKV